MKRYVLLVLIGILCHAPVSLHSQRLPTGAFHDNRSRDFDIHHYRAELTFDLEQRKVSGRATLALSPLRSLQTFALDAFDLRVSTVSGVDGLRWESRPQALAIHLPGTFRPQDTLTVTVEYECHPAAGMYFQPHPEKPGLFHVSTYGEGGKHANWLPIYNDVNDKFSTEMVVTVPDPHVAISNGELVATRTQGGRTTFHWRQREPHANYLITIYIGDFERGELPPAFGSIPLAYWVPRGRLAEGAYAFRNTTRMVEFFSQRLGYRYPWVKYDQIAVPDYAIGAMEHTGVTGHRACVLRDAGAPEEFGPPALEGYASPWSAEATIAHELAHHWFGNNLTCRNLSYIWLNESFASYLMMLWDEERAGREQLLFDVQLARDAYFRYVREQHLIRGLEHHYFDDPNTIYNEEHTYLKGAAILHQLRQVLGDEAFFRALQHYLHKHAFANVVSQDLKVAIEEATGENLAWFFDDWITNGGHPCFEVSWRWLASRRLIDLHVKQVQPLITGQDLFRLPVRLTIATSARTWQEKVWVEQEEHHFLIPSAEKPLLVSFDGEGDLVAEVRFAKGLEELVYQARHDAVPGRLWAIRQLVQRYPVAAVTAQTLTELLADSVFWAVRAEAALQLGGVRTPSAEAAVKRALAAADYRVRKAAVIGLRDFPAAFAEPLLRRVIARETHSDVVAAAILALAKASPRQSPDFILAQLGRPAWYDEITIAGLQALALLASPATLPTIKRYTAARYNQDVRLAALQAWEAIQPDDGELHRLMLELMHSPVYALQQHALEALGRLQVAQAAEPLRRLIERAVDDNLTVLARKALAEIERVQTSR
ncbi:MAG: M1 family metallopeptidase [candidate division KSB1 bacterium]|nr:M1 family metallopeptidase [candidate division KSB1 bacterium]MDZ7273910.1 M1 family metallopeptidase [candidate division KSB1 bacterium]MDZ7286066.1 M1 family metallopeptidase [candidate division KSB1 bacterium]MDZ7299098.1 M1 family metallopeptidase [candidate division KSB1 bacterium]MDZ7306401.1 M1 family metallopeptidase [candidate division KSB1 bacterium]